MVDSGNLGGWLFTVGSLAFLVADMIEWNHYRPVCCHSAIESLEYKVGFNFMLSMLGSLMYLLGSIFFIPATNNLELGEGFFTVGSAVIALSQAWKCYRTCVTPPDRPKLDNIREDTAGFLVDLFAGLGGLFYMIGTIVFGTANTMDDPTYLPAIELFTLGGLGFMSSAIAMQSRYFF